MTEQAYSFRSEHRGSNIKNIRNKVISFLFRSRFKKHHELNDFTLPRCIFPKKREHQSTKCRIRIVNHFRHHMGMLCHLFLFLHLYRTKVKCNITLQIMTILFKCNHITILFLFSIDSRQESVLSFKWKRKQIIHRN